jgi:hypothetical protein
VVEVSCGSSGRRRSRSCWWERGRSSSAPLAGGGEEQQRADGRRRRLHFTCDEADQSGTTVFLGLTATLQRAGGNYLGNAARDARARLESIFFCEMRPFSFFSSSRMQMKNIARDSLRIDG